METSRVISAVRNQAKAKLNQLEQDEPAGTRIEKLAGESYRRRRCAKLLLTNLLAVAIICTVDESINSRYLRCKEESCYLEIAMAKRCRLHKLIRQRFALALKIQQEDFALIISADEATVDSVATQRYPDAIDEPDASNSSIQSRAYLNQLLLINQSQALHI
ncbi:hypothetical protein F511_34753 [Dorcoceras hygrometricum]|uniref:Uncharacterized protein n=1 Tax=Dorcoceras hygrometricum TaxID=472368 RepID=A0A2Z7AYV9_9LAMI|nr:hypothetical protein F511_34753 [Dorcoceras hygrometricum]